VAHLYGKLYPDTFQPFPKNPYLAQLFTQMGRSEELGTGLRNVFKYSKAYSGSDNVIFIEEDIFMVQVPLFSSDTDSDTDNDTDRSRKIIDLMKQNSKITVLNIASNLSLSKSTILREIKDLKEKGKLKQMGKEKDGYWEIPENQ